jgi:hypothetical protein
MMSHSCLTLGLTLVAQPLAALLTMTHPYTPTTLQP